MTCHQNSNAMHRLKTLILMLMILSACSSFVDSVQQTAEIKLQQFLADEFGRQLETGIGSVIDQLAAKRGYLDDPLVRILLPPPLGMALGIALDYQKNPKAMLLETLINQAAEHTIPIAGPILKTIVINMDKPTLENLFDSGNTAATEQAITGFFKKMADKEISIRQELESLL